MCTRSDCQRYIGQYIRFQSPYGYHEGVIERIQGNRAIIMSPRQYIPKHPSVQLLSSDAEGELDPQLVWGFGPGPGAGYGAARPGYGYGGGYGFGWGRWAVSFLVIYALFGLLW